MSEFDAVMRELNFLGVDETTMEVLALLPLIQVAWADGEVQEEEREKILEIARGEYHLNEDGAQILEGWLKHPPSTAYVERSRRALHALAHEREDFDLKPEHLDDVIEFSKQVAQASGGFLGFRTIDKSEALALEEIAATLRLTHMQPVGADLVDFEEDIEDEATDVRSPDEMHQIREAASIAAPDDRELAGEALADLIHHGHDRAAKFVLDKEGLTIGRSRANIVQIQHDGQVSRFHCKLVAEDDKFYLEDNGTTNGTWVNGERIDRRRIYGGEQIQVGDANFTFLVR